MTAVELLAPAITEPGVYDLSDEVYHGDPVPGGSLSVSGARRLLPPSCPALFAYEREHGRPPKADFDFGHAAHKLVLGAGPDIVAVDATDWRTKAAKEARDAAYADGKTPVLAGDYEQIQAMAAALRAHPVAAALFDPDRGPAEQSLFWRDDALWRRARFDCPTAPLVTADGQEVYADYKSTKNASPAVLDRALADYGYIQQAPWYLDGAQALDLCGPDAAFLFVFQEKTPPYLVTVVQPDPMAVRIGRALNRRALDKYQECVETGRWPGYSDDIEMVGVPRWVESQFMEEYV